MRRILIALVVTACGSKGAATDEAAAARKTYAHVLGESMRKSGVTSTFATRGDDASTMLIGPPCDHQVLEQLVADNGADLRRHGFITLECEGGASLAIGDGKTGGDQWGK